MTEGGRERERESEGDGGFGYDVRCVPLEMHGVDTAINYLSESCFQQLFVCVNRFETQPSVHTSEHH